MNRPSSMICPGCGNLISTEETQCPMCGAKHPNLFGIGPYLSRLFGQQIDILTLIPTGCIALFVLTLILDLNAALSGGRGIFGMLSPGARPLYLLGMTGGLARGDWWTVLTATYLHGSLLHIFFNVMWIRQLGPEVGGVYGPARFFIIFTAGGAVGFVLSNLLSGAPTIGASGAIFGLLAALIVYGRTQGGSMSMMTRQVWQWAIFLFIFGFLMSGVNNYAHLGGFIGGWIASKLLVKGAGYRDSRWVTLLAIVLLALTGGGYALSIINNVSVLYLR